MHIHSSVFTGNEKKISYFTFISIIAETKEKALEIGRHSTPIFIAVLVDLTRRRLGQRERFTAVFVDVFFSFLC